MAGSPNLHKKLRNPKSATVSLDSLLGLLSSAYGTEELDTKAVFENNTVNWRNLSVENFNPGFKKEEKNENKIKNIKSERINVATSTTYLKPNRNSGSVTDVTLVTIKSLESLTQIENKSDSENNIAKKELSEPNQHYKHNSEDNNESEIQSGLNSPKIEFPKTGIEEPKESTVYVEDYNNGGEKHLTICGFYIDDSDRKLIFNIKFIKKNNHNKVIPNFDVGEPEITINVIDIFKQTNTCIKVRKSCLVSKTKYFAEVDQEFGLENLTVIVKCNLNLIQWILQWVKADIAMCRPNLNLSNLKEVISLAYQLGIDGLLDDCLDYFHQNFSSVLKFSSDIDDAFDDDLFSMLVKRFSNTEVEEINNEFERFKIKMFCTLIRILGEPKPRPKIGNYFSLATIFMCGSCKKLLPQEMMGLIPCKSDCNQLGYKGELISYHEPLESWDISRYIELMYEDLKSWRLVYWRLWGLCHFLHCTECLFPYPLSQSDWCPYHPAGIEYFPVNANLYHPIGTYQCCGEIAYRFNVLKPYTGCISKGHTPELNTDDKVNIHEIYQKHKYLINYPPPENNTTKKFVKLLQKPIEDESMQEALSKNFWWQGIRLSPKDNKDYSIIPQEILNRLRNRTQEKMCEEVKEHVSYFPQVSFGIMPPCKKCFVNESFDLTKGTSLPDTKINKQKSNTRKGKLFSTCLGIKSKMKKKCPSYIYEPVNAIWQKTESNKDNQDNQRDFEEVAMRRLVQMLSPTVANGGSPEPTAGSYIRLERDWWHEHNIGSTKSSGTVINRTFPLSWFRRLTI